MGSPISFPNLGITVDPSRVAFTVFGKEIYWYGIIIALGFILAVLYACRCARQFGLTEDNIFDMLILAAPLAIVCARLYYCFFSAWDQYAADPVSILYVWEGGLAIYGGVIGAVLGVFLFSRWRKVPMGPMLDIGGMGLLIGQAIGRWGNFINREAHGGITDSFFKMGLTGPDGTVAYYHPTFLYESLWNLVGFALLHFLAKKRRRYDGELFTMYVGWYGLGRVWIEGMRTDSLYIPGTAIRVSQLLAGLSVLAAAFLLVWNVWVRPKDPARMLVSRKAAEDEK